MQQINIDELKPHPRNNEFFDDMTGEKWKEFIESIKSRGVIEPIVITPDRVIVSGHQRVRACKELGIKTVMCDVHTYNNEDEILQDLLETNIRQRGDVGGSAKKIGLRIKELDRLYGIKQGGSGFYGNQYSKNMELTNNYTTPPKTEKDIAEMMGISRQQLQNYKKLAEMIPELEELVDTGIVTPTTALAIMRNLSEEEQVKMISSLDATKKITQKQVQQYVKNMKSENNEIVKNKNKEISSLKAEKEKLERENIILESQKKISDDLANQYKSQSEEYMEVKKRLVHMGLDPEGDYNTFNATVQITELNNEISDLLQNKLAPLKYKPYIFAVKNNELLKKNFMNTLSFIHDWYLTMLSYIGDEDDEKNIIEMENY